MTGWQVSGRNDVVYPDAWYVKNWSLWSDIAILFKTISLSQDAAALIDMPLISTLNGKQFAAESNETLLDAALRANVILEHSCKTGRCGICKSKLTIGVQLAVEDLGDFKLYRFPARDRTAGQGARLIDRLRTAGGLRRAGRSARELDPPGQQRLVIVGGRGPGQGHEEGLEVLVGVHAAGAAGLQQRVEVRAGLRAGGRLTEEPAVAVYRNTPKTPKLGCSSAASWPARARPWS